MRPVGADGDRPPLGLSGAEREALAAAAASDGLPARRARAILLLDGGQSVAGVAGTLGVSRQSVYNWLSWLAHRRGCVVERLTDSARSGRPATKSAQLGALLPRVMGRQPVHAGYDRPGWNLPTLRDYLRREFGLEAAADTVRQTLRSMGYRWNGEHYIAAAREEGRSE